MNFRRSKEKSPKIAKDNWDKFASVAPFLIGVFITGVASAFTHIYNYQQLQVNKIEALHKLRPLLTSAENAEREFGYAAFGALGYEEMAIKIININKDPSGRLLLEVNRPEFIGDQFV